MMCEGCEKIIKVPREEITTWYSDGYIIIEYYLECPKCGHELASGYEEIPVKNNV